MLVSRPFPSWDGIRTVNPMAASDQTTRLVAPTLTADEIRELQDYWEVYEQHREQVTAELLRMASAHPEFRFILENTSLQQSTEEQEASRERQYRAIYHNEWEPYLSNLREQGKQYATAGLSFHAWFELISSFRKFMRPYLLEAFGDTPHRLLGSMNGADHLIEIIMSTIGASYLETKQQLIQEQEQTIQHALERERMDKVFRDLLETAPDAIVVVDGQGKITLVNSQLERMFGYERQEVIGQPIETLVPERFHARHGDHRGHYILAPRVRPMGIGLELFGRRKDGTEFSVEISLSPLHTSEGTLVSASIRDVTERKQIEQKIRQLNEDLEQRNTQLEAANRELEAFSYSVSHDLRAPLRTIDGFSVALLEDFGEQLPDEGRSYLTRIRAAAQRMAQLIDDLLNLSRLTRAPLNPEPTNLSKIAHQILQNLQREAPDRIVNLAIEPNIMADCDPRLIKVALENLFSNAWKFTSKQEVARIEFGRLDDQQHGNVYFVRDNGAGFDMAYVNKLFGAFQRLHTNSEFPGIGIGLAIVQRIINRHGGRVWAEGAVDGGATFYFTLSDYKQRRDQSEP